MPDAYLSFDISVSFRPEKPNGLILYNGKTEDSRDFMSLSLINGAPEFRYIQQPAAAPLHQSNLVMSKAETEKFNTSITDSTADPDRR